MVPFLRICAHTALLVFLFAGILSSANAQCPTCGNGIIDAGETNVNCPQDFPKGASCTSPCSQPAPFETTAGVRLAYDFVGTTTFSSTGLPVGWAFGSAPSASTASTLAAAGTDAYGAKAGLIQPNCSGGCTSTNGFCIGNIASSSAVGAGGTGGKLGANFDGRANINQNLSYAVLRGQNNPTLVSPTYNFSAVQGFKIQFWLTASESSCGQSNGWGSCVGNAAFLDFSTDGGTTWTQILTMNTSSSNSDMCTNNSTNTFWISEGTWHRVCLTVFRTSTSTGNFYPAATGTTAASGMMVNAAYFTANFKFRLRYAQTASCTSGITTTNPGRYLAIDYPVVTSGNEMIPCGISFINMCGYGADNNDDGVGSTSTTSTVVFGTTRRSPNHAERGVEILTSQNASFASQNLSGSAFATNYDLCNAEGGDKQCIDWRLNNNFYTVVYEALMDFERSNITLQYYKGTTPQSTTLTKVTAAGKTPTVGWRYSGSRFVSCGATSDLNPACNGYSFNTGSLPTQFLRTFYHLAINSSGQSWSFYGPTSCSHYFNGPFLAPLATPDVINGETDYIVCTPDPVFAGIVDYCFDDAGYSGNATLNITGPNGYNETIISNGTGTTPIVDPGTYIITPSVPSSPAECVDCARPVCVTITAADLVACTVLPQEITSFSVTPMDYANRVKWATQLESNTDYFILEKSTTGLSFDSLAYHNAIGNGNTLTEYEITDERGNRSVEYYRLKIVRNNGSFIYSKILAVKNMSADFEIYPNPGTGSFSITSQNPVTTIKVFNAQGVLVFQQQVHGSNAHTLDLAGLPSGIYYIHAGNAYTISTKKLIIHK